MRKRHVSVLLKIAISVGLIYLIFHKIAPDWKKCGDQLAGAFSRRYGWLIGAVALEGMAFLVSSVRWKTILHGHDVNVPYFQTLRLFLVGFFFGQFMPGGLAAGDVVRSYYIASCSAEKKMECVATVILDRAIGFLGLVTVVGVALLVEGEYVGRFLMLMGITAALGVGAVLFFSKGVLRKVPFAGWIYEHLPYREQLTRGYEAFRHYRKHKMELMACWGLSLVIQVDLVLVAYCVGRSVGVEAGAFQYLVWIPLIGSIAALPISFGSVGTAEAGYVFLFPKLLAFALMMRLLWFFVASVGGIFWWTQKGAIPRRFFGKGKDGVGDISEKGGDVA